MSSKVATRSISTSVRAFPLAAVPIFLLIFDRLHTGPYAADPDYQYLFNSLNIFYFHPPLYDGHPGTPVQILSAIIIGIVRLARIVQTQRSTLDDVLLHPELYLWWISFAFTTFSAGSIFFLGWRLLVATSSLVVAVVTQVSFLLSYPLLTIGFTQVTPEALLVSLTALLAAAAVPLVFSSVQRDWRLTLPMGVLIGACIATKVTAVPLLLTILLFRGWTAKLVTLLTLIAAFIFFTLPIAYEYPTTAQRFYNILTHAGRYGAGERGLPSLATLWGHAQGVWSAGRELVVGLAIYVCLFLTGAGNRAKETHLQRLFLVSSLVISFLIALVIKQFGGYYLVPVIAIFALANAGVAYLVLALGGWQRWLCSMVGLLLVVLAFRQAESETMYILESRIAGIQAARTFIAKYTEDKTGCALFTFYDPIAIPVWKLYFGNISVDERYGRRLIALYPDFLDFDPRTGQFRTFTGFLDPGAADTRLSQLKCVYLVGYNFGYLGFRSDMLTLVARADDSPASLAVYQFQRQLK